MATQRVLRVLQVHTAARLACQPALCVPLAASRPRRAPMFVITAQQAFTAALLALLLAHHAQWAPSPRPAVRQSAQIARLERTAAGLVRQSVYSVLKAASLAVQHVPLASTALLVHTAALPACHLALCVLLAASPHCRPPVSVRTAQQAFTAAPLALPLAFHAQWAHLPRPAVHPSAQTARLEPTAVASV